MFYAAEALLLSRGLVFSKHGAVIAEFSREFVRSGEFSAEYARALRDALDERIVADYHATEHIPAARAEALLIPRRDRAGHLVARASRGSCYAGPRRARRRRHDGDGSRARHPPVRRGPARALPVRARRGLSRAPR